MVEVEAVVEVVAKAVVIHHPANMACTEAKHLSSWIVVDVRLVFVVSKGSFALVHESSWCL